MSCAYQSLREAERRTNPLGEFERLRLNLLLLPRRLDLDRVLDVEGDRTCRVLDLVRTLENGVVRSRSENRLVPPLNLRRRLSLQNMVRKDKKLLGTRG